jgi:hypothetical protein
MQTHLDYFKRFPHLKAVLFICLICFTFSCEIQPELTKQEKYSIPTPQVLAANTETTAFNPTMIISLIQINLNVSPEATGNIIVELRTDDGLSFPNANIIAERNVSEMASKGKPTWYTFRFVNRSPAPLQFNRGTKLKLYITRSEPHNVSTNNTVYISTSYTDSYLLGTSSLANKDISFLTYDSNDPIRPVTDQRQLFVRDRQPLDQGSYVWQQFEVGNSAGPAVAVLTDVDLNMFAGTTSSGLVELSITNTLGTETLAITSLTSTILRGNGAGFNWNKFSFASPLIISLGQKYRLQVALKNSADNPASNDFVVWAVSEETCSDQMDFYRPGRSSRTCDFAFKANTYAGTDQKQERSFYPSILEKNVVQWQEFVPGSAQ